MTHEESVIVDCIGTIFGVIVALVIYYVFF